MLSRQLRSKNTERRKKAAEWLGDSGNIDAIAPLIDALRDKDNDVQEAAQMALVKIATTAIQPLVEKLKSENEVVVYTVLAAIAAASVQTLLTEFPSEDEDSLVEFVKKTSLEILGKISVRETIKARLSKLRNVVIKPLLVALEKSTTDFSLSDTQRLAKEALIEIGSPAVVPLIEMLDHRNCDARAAAAETLGEIRDRRAVEPLIAALKDEYYAIRERAAEALGRIGDERAAQPLMEILRTHMQGPIAESYYVREKAVIALGRIGDKRAVQPLIELLKHLNAEVRMLAAMELGTVGDVQALPMLEFVAEYDTDTDVRTKAKEAIRKITENVQ